MSVPLGTGEGQHSLRLQSRNRPGIQEDSQCRISMASWGGGTTVAEGTLALPSLLLSLICGDSSPLYHWEPRTDMGDAGPSPSWLFFRETWLPPRAAWGEASSAGRWSFPRKSAGADPSLSDSWLKRKLSPPSLALLSYLDEGHVPSDHPPELLGRVHVPDVGLGERGQGAGVPGWKACSSICRHPAGVRRQST